MSFIVKDMSVGIEVPPGVDIREGVLVRFEPAYAERLDDVMGCVQYLPPDMAQHHNHHLHGSLMQ